MGSRLVRCCLSFLAQPPATTFDPFGIRKHGFDAVADQIAAIKDGWRLNMTELAEMNALIPERIGQYREARARSLELLGERPQAPASSPSKAAWRLNRQWARNAKSLHRARKRAD
jgi:hypothetical protein